MNDLDPTQNNQNQQGTPVPPPPPAQGAPVPPPMPPPAAPMGGAPVPPPAQGAPVPPPMPPPAAPMGGTPVPPPPPAQGAPVPPPMPPPAAPMSGAPIPPPPPAQGVYPPPAQPATGTPATGGFPPPPRTPLPPADEDTSPANFQLGKLLPEKLNIPIPPSELDYDPEYFFRILAGSISLSKDEKKRIIDTIPKLKQAQIDELKRIFEEEGQKFSMLSKKHVPQLEKLAKQHYNDWMDLEADYAQHGKKEEEQAQADEIRKNLGL